MLQRILIVDPSETAQAALAEVIRRRLAGEPQAEEAVIAEHPELADELRAELAKLWVGDDAVAVLLASQ